MSKSTNLDLRTFEQACVEAVKAGFPVRVAPFTNERGVTVTIQGVQIIIEQAGWCRKCKHLLTLDEMQRPGLCKECGGAAGKTTQPLIEPR